MKQGEEERKPERRREQRGNRQPGTGPGLSLAKVEAFASCQLETAALGQKDGALRSFCRLVCLSVFVWLCAQHGCCRALRAQLMC